MVTGAAVTNALCSFGGFRVAMNSGSQDTTGRETLLQLPQRLARTIEHGTRQSKENLICRLFIKTSTRAGDHIPRSYSPQLTLTALCPAHHFISGTGSFLLGHAGQKRSAEVRSIGVILPQSPIPPFFFMAAGQTSWDHELL